MFPAAGVFVDRTAGETRAGGQEGRGDGEEGEFHGTPPAAG